MRKIKVSTAIALLDIFWPTFEEVGGLIFLANIPRNTSGFDDQTDMETTYNHTHLIDLFNNNAGLQPVDENDYRFTTKITQIF